MFTVKTALAATTASLLLSTAVCAQDMIVEEAANTYVLTAGAGVVAFNVPAFSTPAMTSAGALNLGLGDYAIGGLLGVNISTQIGAGDGTVTSIGLNGFGAFARRSGSATTTLTNDDYLFIPGITTPTGTVTLTTTPATPAGTAAIAGTDTDQGATATNSNVGGAQNGYGVVPSAAGDGFSYIGIGTLSPDSAYSFGAIANEAGGVFVAVGDLAGWQVSTAVTQDIFYTGADLTLALSALPGADGVGFTGYVGPSYRYLGQRIGTTISVDPFEFQPTSPADFAYPTYMQKTDESLSTHYLGGILGGNVTVPMGDVASLSLGLEGGIYYTSTSYGADETYSVTGGNPLAVSETVANAVEISSSDTGVAYALRTQASYTTPVSDGMQFTLGLGGEYLSQVAAIGRDSAAASTGLSVIGDDATYTGPDTTMGNSITYSDMWSVTLTGSLTGQF